MSNPRIPRKKGQPAKSKKHSDLYTDEDPKGTIHGLGFKDVATSKASVSKIRKSSRSHAHKIQAAIAMEQRARVMGKTAEAAIYRSFINSMKKKTKKMNEENVEEGWSDKYKKSIDCNNPKGFSQKAHCQGKRKKMNEDRQIKKIVKQLRKSVKSHAKQADTLEKKITEGSLHKWFKGSKSKDGKGGWVNVVTGGTCASDEPGEGTPKCVSSAKRASMSKKERLSAARRKKKADPNQQAKTGAAKPTYVSTDKPKKKIKEAMTDYGSQSARDDDDNKVAVAARKRIYNRASTKDKNMMDAQTIAQQRNKVRDKKMKADQNKPEVNSVGTLVRSKLKVGEFKKMKESYGGKGVSRKAKLMSTHPPTAQAAIKNIPTETDRGSGNKAKRRAGMPVEKKSPTYKAYMTNKEEVSYFDLPLEVEIPSNLRDFNKGLMFRESLENDKGMLFIFERVGRYSFYMKNTTIPLDVAFVTEDGIIDSIKELEPNDETPVTSEGEVIFAIEVNRGWFAENNVEVGDELVLGEAKDKKGKGSGTKDACYHKVKSRYSVWPSAYASGALVKCRKVGAANWGNKSESVEMKNYLDKKAKKLEKQRAAQPDRYKNNPAFDSTSPNSKDPAVARTRAEEVEVVEAKYEAGASDYGKASIRNKRKFGTKGENPDPITGENPTKNATRGELMTKRREEHKAKRGVKTTGMKEETLDEKKAQKCWPGYEKKGTKMMFGKRYNNCVKKKVKREEYSDWRDEIELTEKIGGAGTLVRQGVKVGGKKGGQAVQKVTTAATAAGKAEVAKAQQGNQSKMVGDGKNEKRGAAIGAALGGAAGFAIPDGPAMVAGELAGGYLGSKVGGKIGRQFDKMGAKKPMKEGVLDKKIPLGKNELKKNYGKQFSFPLPGPLKNIQIDLPGSHSHKKINGQTYSGTNTQVGLSPTGKANVTKLAKNVVGPAAAGLAVSKGVDSLMKMGKKKNTKESFSNWRDELGYEGKDSSKKIDESHYGKSVNKIPKELDKAVALHKSQAERLRKSPEFKKDAGEIANKIPDQLDKAVAMHTKQAKQLRDAGVGEKNCGCGKTPCKTYGKQEVKEAKSPAWQRKEGKSESGGLNAKGVASYRKANPGSKLKTAVTTKPSKLKKGSKASKRRKSFCARMKGMKKRLTSAKTARDPDSRINKSLRKWNCSYEPTGTTIAEKALSKKQQKFFGIVRAAQKGTLDGEASPQVQRAAADMKMKDVKKFASTKHKGLPEKVKSEE